MGLTTHDSPRSILRSAAATFRLDFWEGQRNHVEVWVEKDALTGVISPICNEYRVDFFACKGYTSQSEQWRAGQRFINRIEGGQKVIILHLGDHDPSGIDMTRDNLDRLKMFVGHETDRSMIEVKRLALNMDQVKKYKPPPNPAKLTDSRIGGYQSKFGKSSWELDALDPTAIRDIIESNVKKLITDKHLWQERVDREERYKARLEKVAKNFRA